MSNMKNALLPVCTSFVFLAGSFSFAQQPRTDTNRQPKLTATNSGSSQVQGYDAIRATLTKHTSVPLRLPTFIPPYADDKNPLNAILDSVSSHDYRVQIAWAKDCQGGNWCHLGEIIGSTLPPPSDGPRSPVELGFGLHGYFVNFTCGAHCDDAGIYWAEGGYYYSIAMKAERKQILLKMARSAIAASRSGSPTTSPTRPQN
jgi:hypothetical protein